MIRFTEERLHNLFKNFEKAKIAVIGDIMLDRYIWGNVSRISPEAPVPVVEVEDEDSKLGGAGNVANNIKSLGAFPLLIGVVGDDREGEILFELMREQGFNTGGIIIDSSRPTTVKTRVIAHNQHVVRIDRESKEPINYTIQERIKEIILQNVYEINAIIIEDYNKGVIVKNLIHDLVEIAKRFGIVITVDPKFDNFFEFKNVTVFKPNRKEVEDALGEKLDTEDKIIEAGKTILEKLKCEYLLLTRGEKGMTLFNKNGEIKHIPTKARKVADVSGAGDTVISTLTVALASGADIIESATLANYAAGIVVEEVGVVPVDREKLFKVALLDSRGEW
ncbi:MAG: D-glycero-beta-D-manno-heptose-7-phosphate kinase [Candidatus Kryptonium sp.]|nr:D-glycero-beta-D-manno-heptose-7-phosphate kinase [Candidatus Kryptonium sp.]MDW8109090.1 D-glycero-beta-D-manno-heptose-7-phosphate kinase [Candidatus Kryptonium sp.]